VRRLWNERRGCIAATACAIRQGQAVVVIQAVKWLATQTYIVSAYTLRQGKRHRFNCLNNYICFSGDLQLPRFVRQAAPLYCAWVSFAGGGSGTHVIRVLASIKDIRNEDERFRGRKTITYLFRLVLLHANCVKKPHRSPAMVTFFALLAHKITSPNLSNLLLRDPLAIR